MSTAGRSIEWKRWKPRISPVRHYLRNRYLLWRSHLEAEWTHREVRRQLAYVPSAAAQQGVDGRPDVRRAAFDGAWDA